MSRDAGYYYVYMLTNASRVVLYIGVTGDVEGRLSEHRAAETKSFTQRYRVNRLVWYEDYPDPISAITREKQRRLGPKRREASRNLGGPSTSLHSAQDDRSF